jgi:peroxiredoxin
VGITPELPNGLLTMTEKHNLEFEILTDYRNEYARKLSLIYKQPDSMRTAFEQMKIPVWDKNDDNSLELPIPTTLLVDQKGVVQNLQADPDFLKRVEPTTVLEWVKNL